MEENVLKPEQSKPNGFLVFLKKVNKALHNRTFLYILRRVLSSIFTLMLLIAIITALLRLLPDTNFYDLGRYKKLAGQGEAGKIVAERYRITELYKYGRLDLQGNRIPVIQNIFTYYYYLLPIPKKIPVRWDTRYKEITQYYDCIIYLGKSVTRSEYVIDMFKSGIGYSFAISIICVVFSYLFSIPLGIAMAKKPGGVIDKIGNAFIVLNYAIPALVFYLAMNVLLGNSNGPFGWANFSFFYEAGRPITLFPPIFCAVFLSIPGVSIWVRRFMIDELTSDYVKFARAKGLSESTIMYKHVFRNAMIPLVRNIPGTFIGAIVGSYYLEYIWKIPGTGKLLVEALQGTPDVQVVQSLSVVYAAMSMLSFLLGDLITVAFDPRIKLED